MEIVEETSRAAPISLAKKKLLKSSRKLTDVANIFVRLRADRWRRRARSESRRARAQIATCKLSVFG